MIENLPQQTYVVASQRPWNQNLAKRLDSHGLGKFISITEPSDLTMETLTVLKPKYVFFPHWSKIIPEQIHQNFCCIVFHMTDLPFGRGGSPLQNLILRGFKETQVSALRCVEEIDAGPIYLKRSVSLEGKASEIFSRVDEVIENMIHHICEKSPTPSPQVGEVSHFKRRQAYESRLPGDAKATELFDFIRMLDADGYPRAFIEYGQYMLEFNDAQLDSGNVVANVIFRKRD